MSSSFLFFMSFSFLEGNFFIFFISYLSDKRFGPCVGDIKLLDFAGDFFTFKVYFSIEQSKN